MVLLGNLFQEGFGDGVEIAGLAAVLREAILEERFHMLILNDYYNGGHSLKVSSITYSFRYWSQLSMNLPSLLSSSRDGTLKATVT